MKIEHTPEPWHVKCEKFEKHYHNPNAWPRLFSGDFEICGPEGFYSESLKQDKTNAQRIVACVNACKGIDNNTLARAGVVQRGELGDVIRQRDILLEALKKYVELEESEGFYQSVAHKAIESAFVNKGEQHA